MDPMKSRRWIAAAALAAAVVFLVMVTGEHGPAAPDATPAPVSSSGAVLASDGGPPDDESGNEGAGNGEGSDRDEIIGALKGLLDALGISADELGEGADCGNGGQEKSESENGSSNGGNGNGNKENGNSSNGEANGAGCEQLEPSSADQSEGESGERSEDATITIAGFAFGQTLTVEPGATVKVVNTDAAPHNVTAGDESFKTKNLNQDDTATFTAPTTPGRYEFSCTLHPEMTGTLIVEGNGGEQSRSRSSEPATGSQRGSSSGGDHDSSQQHQTTAPGRANTGGSSDGY